MIWNFIEYNIGNGYDSSNGKFTAPVDGIYFFHSQCRTYGTRYANIGFYLNGSGKTWAKRDEDDGYDTVTATAQFKLKKGDTVNVYFGGYWNNPAFYRFAYFEGHLIRQINE